MTVLLYTTCIPLADPPLIYPGSVTLTSKLTTHQLCGVFIHWMQSGRFDGSPLIAMARAGWTIPRFIRQGGVHIPSTKMFLVSLNMSISSND